MLGVVVSDVSASDLSAALLPPGLLVYVFMRLEMHLCASQARGPCGSYPMNRGLIFALLQQWKSICLVHAVFSGLGARQPAFQIGLNTRPMDATLGAHPGPAPLLQC